ncbi:MAG: TIGR00725 family protein [Candidatus Omnitrophica bacterium 4484_70.1]|nr:MAG: TIGR00725 family protein [Candidatus Omnitrophica bacterium 4484_70.1]
MNVAVIGGHKCSGRTYTLSKRLGELIALKGWILICGGGGGVMEAACLGAKEKGGVTVGLLPAGEEEANPYLDIKIPTGLGYARNILVVRAASVAVAVDGKYGTLSEIAFALNEGKPVLGINTWDIKGIIKVNTPEEAVEYIEKKVCRKLIKGV